MENKHTFALPAANVARLIAKAKEGSIESMKPVSKLQGRIEVTFVGTAQELFELGEKMGRPDSH